MIDANILHVRNFLGFMLYHDARSRFVMKAIKGVRIIDRITSV